jgi:4-amino-4-deoxy-L-arabinose transferase-like glycosyltransferase
MPQLKLPKQNTIFIIILAVSVLLRLVSAIALGNQVVELPGTADQISYDAIAQRVLNGHGFTFDKDWWPATPAGEQTAHWSFLYTFYLVAVYALFGPNPIAARVIQAVIVGILHPYLIYKMGDRVVGRVPALIAAAITAVYAYFIYYAGTLMTEPFYISAILASLYLGLLVSQPEEQSGSRRKILLLVALGITLGCAVLLRQLFLLFIPFLLIWIGWREYKQRRPYWGLKLIIPVCVVALMIVPFTVFNYQRFGQFVLLNTNAGFAFFWGNHPFYGTQFIPILPSDTYRELIPKELLRLSEPALDSALLKIAIQTILGDPVRYLLLSLSRIPFYFEFWPSADSGLVSNLSRVASFGIFWPFMLYGLIRWLLVKGFRSFSSPAWLLLLFVTIYTGIHILTWTLIRYRLPVDAVLLLFAGVALYDLYQRVTKSKPITEETGPTA